MQYFVPEHQLCCIVAGQAPSFCDAGASDDIRRATELAYRAVSEFGLSSVVGPLAVASMGGGDEGSLMLRDSGEPSPVVCFCNNNITHDEKVSVMVFWNMSWLHLLLSSVKMQAVLRLTILSAWLRARLPDTGALSTAI